MITFVVGLTNPGGRRIGEKIKLRVLGMFEYTKRFTLLMDIGIELMILIPKN